MITQLPPNFILSTLSLLGRTGITYFFSSIFSLFRGKFIYISPEELEAVAKFIKQQGRVSISDLALNSNKLISL